MSPVNPSPGGNSQKFYGKYRGTVIENIDPLQMGRVMLQCPDVLGETPSSWAMPCVPAAGIQSGCFIVPANGSQVWVEFEQGNPDYPIWVGGFWGSAGDAPAMAIAPPPLPPGGNIVLQTPLENKIILSDSAPTPATGGVVLMDSSGAMLVINETGIFLDNGQGATITLIGSAVAINETALTVVGP